MLTLNDLSDHIGRREKWHMDWDPQLHKIASVLSSQCSIAISAQIQYAWLRQSHSQAKTKRRVGSHAFSSVQITPVSLEPELTGLVVVKLHT